MLEPKPIAKQTVPAALERALRYRLLNEPVEAESICRDILEVDPSNKDALITMLLALTDQFETKFAEAFDGAKDVLPRLEGQYERAYYEGIIHERWAKAQLTRGMPGEAAYNWFRQALRCYETAERLSPPDNPDAILRWNTCVRMLARFDRITPATERESMTHDVQADFGDDTGSRGI
jgi:hypothetical protein